MSEIIGSGRIQCKLCGNMFRSISHTHCRSAHGISLKEYINMFPEQIIHQEMLPDEKKLLLDAVKGAFK